MNFKSEIQLNFVPNDIFTIDSLNFDDYWTYFLDKIQEKRPAYKLAHTLFLKRILDIRNAYIQILNKIKCNRIIIFTDANYKTEHDFTHNIQPNITSNFKQIIHQFEIEDKVKLYNFIQILEQKTEFDGCYDIAFIDTF